MSKIEVRESLQSQLKLQITATIGLKIMMKITEKDKYKPREKRQRSANFSFKETQVLVDIVVTKYANIIENKQTDAVTLDQKRQAWEKIHGEFNAVSGATSRLLKTLQIKYEGLKRALRKKKARNNFETYKKTGGGDAECIPYTDNEEKLLSILALSVEGLPSRNDCDDINGTPEIEKEPNFTRNNVNNNYEKILTEEVNNPPTTVDEENNMNLENVDIESLDIENMDVETGTVIYTQPKDTDLEAETSEEHLPESDNINISDPPPSQSSKRLTRWSNWNPSKLKKPTNSKLLVPKKIKDNEKSTITEKYSLLADQIAVTKKEMELKQKEIDFVEVRNQRDKVEHQKRIRLLDLQIMNCSK